MSPELFDPEKFDLKDSRQTKHSDCYALGMVVYEVLSGRVPFYRHNGPAVIWAIMKGERPKKPRGEGGTWFTDGIWSVMERCWVPNPGDRPSVEDVLQCLERASRSWTPPYPQAIINLPTTNSPTRNPDTSTEESTDENEVPSPPQITLSQPLQEPPLKGAPNGNSIHASAHQFSAPPRGALDCQNLEASVVNHERSDSEDPAGIPDRVSWAVILCGFWH